MDGSETTATSESLDSEILTELKETNKNIYNLFSLIKAQEDDRLKDKEAQATKDSEQATKDSEQATRDSETEIKSAATIEAEKKQKEADLQLEQTRHAELLKELKLTNEQVKELAESTSSSDLLAEAKDTNTKLQTIADNQNTSVAHEANQVSLGTMTVAVLIVAVGAAAVFKFGSAVVSKITQMMW